MKGERREDLGMAGCDVENNINAIPTLFIYSGDKYSIGCGVEMKKKGLHSEDVTALYGSGLLTINECATALNCNQATIRYHLKKEGVTIRTITNESWKLSEEDKKGVVKLYEEGKNIHEIADIFYITPQPVWRILKRRGVVCRSPSDAARKYFFDKYFFDDIDCEKKAYWLGFIFADGCVQEDKLRIRLSYKEVNHLKKFKKDISSDHLIYKPVYKNKNIPDYTACEIVIGDNRSFIPLVKQIKDKIPDIPETLMPHFVRGLFDGDGCISKSNKNSPGFDLIANYPLCCKIQEMFIQELGLSETKFHKVVSSKNSVSMRYNGTRVVRRIYNYLYRDSHVCLERKEEKFRDFVTPKKGMWLKGEILLNQERSVTGNEEEAILRRYSKK